MRTFVINSKVRKYEMCIRDRFNQVHRRRVDHVNLLRVPDHVAPIREKRGRARNNPGCGLERKTLMVDFEITLAIFMLSLIHI